MAIDPGRVDRTSLRALRDAFRAAPDPDLSALVGTHEAEFVGPGWLRAIAPAGMRVGRMTGWCGKRFEPDDDADGVLHGANLVRVDGVVRDSVPITARVAPSLVDGRPALAVGYPADAPFPWARVTDELRPFGEGTLIALTFGIPLSPPGGFPFLLHRAD